MFDHLGWAELAVLAVLALFVFGPDRLPKVAADAGRMLRQLRAMATGMTDNLKAELGPEVGDLDLASLHPRTLVRKHLLDDPTTVDAEPAPRPSGPPLRPGEPAPYDADAT